MKAYYWFGFAMLVFFSSCKKDEEAVDTCTNGFLNPGEVGIDCGGTCAPCIAYTPSYVYLECNDQPITMDTKSLSYSNGNWSLLAFNDSLKIQLNLGNNGGIDVYPISSSGSFGEYFGNLYLSTENGTFAIYNHDTINHKMGGFFQVDFIRTGINDTLKIRNGQFENMIY
jgi:hypothetical protein